MGYLLPDADQAESKAAPPALLSKGNWLSYSNVILTSSPKAREDEDQKAPHICSQFLCTGGVALGWSVFVPVHSCSLSRLSRWGAAMMISDDHQVSFSPRNILSRSLWDAFQASA